VTLKIGVVVNAVIQFIIAIFWLIKALTRHVRAEPVPAAPPKSEVLPEETRDLLAEKRA